MALERTVLKFSKETRLQDKPFQSSKVTFAHVTLNSGFQISGDMTEPGSFDFGFVHMFVCTRLRSFVVWEFSEHLRYFSRGYFFSMLNRCDVSVG